MGRHGQQCPSPSHNRAHWEGPGWGTGTERDEVVEELCTAGDGSEAPYGCPQGRAEWVPFKGAACSAQRAVIWMLWVVSQQHRACALVGTGHP